MKSFRFAVTAFLIFFAPAASSNEDIEREFRDRSVILSSGEIGSGFILGSEGDTVFVVTAYHVVKDALNDASGRNLSELLTITPLARQANCSHSFSPEAAWYPKVESVDGTDDFAIIKAKSTCKISSYPISVAWADAAPSLGIQMQYVDLISIFSTARVSPPIYLANSCIRRQDCFNSPLVKTQYRFNSNDSGSALFSDQGLVGIVTKNDGFLSVPAILAIASGCVKGDCR